jgi:hypothetical protein
MSSRAGDMPMCRYVPEVGYVTRMHLRDCVSNKCEGCKPCTDMQHCTARRRCCSHIDATLLTCPSCVRKTKGDVVEIAKLSILVLGDAFVNGVDSTAANLHGPHSDPRTDRDLRVAAFQTSGVHVFEDETDRHPLNVLGTWEMMLREDYGEDYADLPPVTIAGAAKYLLMVLNHRGLADDPNQDFPLFVREIAACRSHLEAVHRDSRMPELGVDCPDCGEARLRKVFHNTNDQGWEDLTGASDEWVCNSCEASWSEADYRLRVAQDYLAHAPALTADQIALQHPGIPASTIRRWASVGRRMTDDGWVSDPPKLRSCGRDHQGRVLYRVAEVLELRDKRAGGRSGDAVENEQRDTSA